MSRVLDQADTRSPESRRRVDRAFVALCLGATSIAILALAVLLASIITQGAGAIDADFLTGRPASTPGDAGFGYPIVGSIAILVVCAIAGIPLGVATALFLEEFRPRSGALRPVHGVIQTNIRNLAGVPSIVYGVIGLTVFVRVFGLFGSPLQYERFTEILTDDGERIVGQLLPRELPAVDAFTAELGSVPVEARALPASIVEQLAGGETVSIDAAMELTDDFLFIVRAPELGEIAIDAFDVETDIGGSDPFLSRPITITLSAPPDADLGAEPTERLRTVLDGIVEVPRSRIADRRGQMDAVFIRRHRFTLDSGERLAGSIVGYDGDAPRLRDDRTGEMVSIDPATITAYHPDRMFTLGDEDWPVYIRLPLGPSVLAGGLTLMLVVLPIVIIASQEAIRSVPESRRAGAAALGATRWQAVWHTVLPGALPGILTGSILAMSRAIGETAPILVVGAATFVTIAPTNLMSEFSAMPLQIYDWSKRPEAVGFKPLAAGGIIVLLGVLLTFNAFAVALRQWLQRRSHS
ncbi:MAG: ABC transporter permease subunit [Planctomycetota bacterium]